MKILIVRNYPSYMDVRKRTYNIQELGLAKAFVRLGNQCGIVFWTNGSEEELDYSFDQDRHVQIYYRKGKSLFNNTVFENISDIISKYDVIQANEYNQIQAWLLAKKYPCKVVIYHGPYFCKYNYRYNAMCKMFDTFFLRKYIKNNTIFITKSRFAGDFLYHKGIKKENIKVLGVGIDLDALGQCDTSVPEFIKNADAPETYFRMLYVGHLDVGRNIRFMLEVAAEIKKRGYPIKLTLVGKGEEKYVAECWQYAESLQIIDDIYHIDVLEQKYLSQLYPKSDFFLFPSRFDIFGMVLLEAMYFGLVAMTTEHGGSDMMIQTGCNGYKLSLNVQTWVNQMIELKANPQLMSQVKLAAHDTVANSYTWDILAPEFIEVYRQFEKKGQ